MNTPSASDQRLASLDALRGFDMCWILGLEPLLKAVLHAFFPNNPLTLLLTEQLSHAAWDGFHFYDLIFPLFVFLSGVSLSLALPKRVEREGRSAALRHLLARGLVLFLLGVFFSGGLKDGWDKIRWLGVLQRIGIASVLAGVLSLWLSSRALVATAIAILGGYCALFAWVSVPGTGESGFVEGHNIVNYFDSVWLPGRRYNGTHDPEGILSTIPAVVSALLGVLAGRWLMCGREPRVLARNLVLAGMALVAAGWAWHPFFPIIKKLWTSSFVLVAGGWSFVFLGVFYWAIDMRGWKRWIPPFVWVGANPIALYLLSGMGLFKTVSERIAGKAPEPAWMGTLVVFGAMLLLARWMFQRKIWIKV